MTPSEFKAWSDGFTEAIGDRPSDKQWQRIKDRVAEIDGTSAVPFYIERYRPCYIERYGPWWVSSAALAQAQPSYVVNGPTTTAVLTMTATDIMTAAGRMDAEEVAG